MYYDDWAADHGGDDSASPPPALLRLLNEVEERNVNRVMRWNVDGSACVRMTQRELSLSSGDRIVTHVEALYRNFAAPPPDASEPSLSVVFSIRHMHSLSWARELSVHRSILTACYLTDVEPLVELPESSVKLCESAESSSQLLRTHIFIEKIIPHLRFASLGNEVSVFWWRAVNFGCLALLNWQSGRLVLLESKGRSIRDGVVAIRNFFQLAFGDSGGGGLPEDFWIVNSEYDGATTAAQEEAEMAAHTRYISSAQIAQILESWTLEDGVSPWLTKLVVKKQVRGKVQSHYRYSLGVEIQHLASPPGGGEPPTTTATAVSDSSLHHTEEDDSDEATTDLDDIRSHRRGMIDTSGSGVAGRGGRGGAGNGGGGETEEVVGHQGGGGVTTTTPPALDGQASSSVYLLIQVHFNEPLSRELRAYPVCMIPVYIHSSSHGDLTLIYLRCLWFLRKLYEYHARQQEIADSLAAARKTPADSLAKNGLRPIHRIDQNDLSQQNKLIGGAKLVNRKRLI